MAENLIADRPDILKRDPDVFMQKLQNQTAKKVFDEIKGIFKSVGIEW